MAKFLQIGIANTAKAAVFECDRIALMHARADRIHAGELPGHGEVNNLLTSIIDTYARPQESALNGIQRVERGPCAMKMFVALERTAVRNDVHELSGLVQCEMGRQAP